MWKQIQFCHLYYAWSCNGRTIIDLEILKYRFFLYEIRQNFVMRYNIPTDFVKKEWDKYICRLVAKSKFLILPSAEIIARQFASATTAF